MLLTHTKKYSFSSEIDEKKKKTKLSGIENIDKELIIQLFRHDIIITARSANPFSIFEWWFRTYYKLHLKKEKKAYTFSTEERELIVEDG